MEAGAGRTEVARALPGVGRMLVNRWRALGSWRPGGAGLRARRRSGNRPLAQGAYSERLWMMAGGLGWGRGSAPDAARIAEVALRSGSVEYTLAGTVLPSHRIGWSVQVLAAGAAERDEGRASLWRQGLPVIKARR